MLKRVILLALVLNVYVAVNTDSMIQSKLTNVNETTDQSCFKVDEVMDPVEPVNPVDPCEPLVLNSDVQFNDICTADTPCGRCMGECDSDDHCAEGLTCFQRDGYARVPGCLSFGPGDFADYDYCHDASCPTDNAQTCGPLPLDSLEQANGICTEATPCEQCQGECDSDDHCAGEMVCFQRDGLTKVPGCIGGGEGDFTDYDYCVHPECEAAEAAAVEGCLREKVAPTITYKSVPGAQVSGGSAAQWEARVSVAQPSPPATCEVALTDLVGLNNQVNCQGGTHQNIYFQYTVTFDLCQGMDMNWHVPVDAGWGGAAAINGVEVARYDGDIWQGGNSSNLDFTVSLPAGQHVMVLYGGEGCCDGQTNWTVNGQSLSLTEMMSW